MLEYRTMDEAQEPSNFEVHGLFTEKKKTKIPVEV
jgi:hypothetical protein